MTDTGRLTGSRERSQSPGRLEELADRIEKLEAERQDIAYHAEQMSTYLAQPTISEKNLTSARLHNDKIRAALVSAPPSPVVPDER